MTPPPMTTTRARAGRTGSGMARHPTAGGDCLVSHRCLFRSRTRVSRRPSPRGWPRRTRRRRPRWCRTAHIQRTSPVASSQCRTGSASAAARSTGSGRTAKTALACTGRCTSTPCDAAHARRPAAAPSRWRAWRCAATGRVPSSASSCAETKRIFDASCIDDLRTYSSPAGRGRVEHHDGLAEQQRRSWCRRTTARRRRRRW